MAKESIKSREHKRERIVSKYAEKRKSLKEAGDYAALQKLPKNGFTCAFGTTVANSPAGPRAI